ncbi:hypothetical protein Pmar_PMAR006486, partial [Perkinsus marinus ATCC 50983]
MDASARESMKDAAKRDKHCDIMNPSNIPVYSTLTELAAIEYPKYIEMSVILIAAG